MLSALTANATDFYLVGDFNRWSFVDEYKFTETSTAGVYELNFSGNFENGELGFRVAGEDWSPVYSATSTSSKLTLGEAFPLKEDGDCIFMDIDKGKAVENPKITLNTNDLTLKIEGNIVDAPVIEYSLYGCFDDGDTWSTKAMSSDDDITWTANVIVKKASSFKVREMKNDNLNADYAASSATTVAGDAEMTLTSANAQDIGIEPGFYLFSFNSETFTLTITKDDPTFYLDIHDGGIDIVDYECKFTKTDEVGVYELKFSDTHSWNNYVRSNGFRIISDNFNWHVGTNGSDVLAVNKKCACSFDSWERFTLDKYMDNPTITLNINDGTIMVTNGVQISRPYIAGIFNGWGNHLDISLDEYTFTETSTAGIYELNFPGNLANGETGFIIKSRDNYGIEIGPPSVTDSLTIGETYTFEQGYCSFRMKIDDFKAIANPKITFNANVCTLKVEGELVDSEPVLSYHIKGSYDDGSTWTTTDLLYGGENEMGNLLDVKTTAKLGIMQTANTHDYKLYSAASATTISDNTEIALTVTDTQNISLEPGKYTLSFNPETKTLAIKKVENFYLLGNFNDWQKADEKYKFTATETAGVYELKFSGTLFNSFAINDGSNYHYITTLNAIPVTVNEGKEYYESTSLYSGFSLIKAVKDATITLNTNDKTITVSGDIVELPYYYAINKNTKEVKLTDTGNGIYTAEFESDGYLFVGKYADLYGSCLVEGYWGDATVTGDVTEVTLASNEFYGTAYIYLPVDGACTVTLDSNTMKMTVTKKTDGISTVSAETVDSDAPAYNLAGQRVNKDTKGLVVIGGKKYYRE